jgi:hypothetical protein
MLFSDEGTRIKSFEKGHMVLSPELGEALIIAYCLAYFAILYSLKFTAWVFHETAV